MTICPRASNSILKPAISSALTDFKDPSHIRRLGELSTLAQIEQSSTVIQTNVDTVGAQSVHYWEDTVTIHRKQLCYISSGRISSAAAKTAVAGHNSGKTDIHLNHDMADTNIRVGDEHEYHRSSVSSYLS